MILNYVKSFLGIRQLPVQAQDYLLKYSVLYVISSFIMNLSHTFFVLTAIDKLGFAETGVMISVMLLVQFIFDYPSGSLGDWIGQRWVLTISYLSYAVGFFVLVSAQSFGHFVLVAVSVGFGHAQHSGAMESWLDNNYQRAVGDHDPDKKIYGFSSARINTINNLAYALAFIIGGSLATMFSRQFVFLLQVGLFIIEAIIVLKLVIDIELDEIPSPTSRKDSENYFTYLIGGFKFLGSSKTAFFFIFGLAFLNSTWNIWGNLILFPLYFGYSGSDSIAGILRTIIYFVTLPVWLYVAKWSQNMSNERYPRMLFLHLILFFPSFALVMIVVPLQNTFNLLGIFCIIVLFFVLTHFFALTAILQQRIMIDLIPSENRNAVYSLIPTLVAFFGIFLLPIAGFLVEKYNLIHGIVLAQLVYIIGFLTLVLAIKTMYEEPHSKINLQKDKKDVSSVTN